MNNTCGIKFAGLVAILWQAGVSSSLAAIQTFSADFGSSGSPLGIGGSQILSLEKFNPSLGTLTGATLSLLSHATVESQVLNFSQLAQQYSAAMATVPVGVTALGGLTFSSTPTAGPFSGTVPGPKFNVVVAGSASVFSLSTATVAVPDLILYQGSGGQSFDVLVGLASGIYSGVSLGPVFFGGDGTAYGTVAIEYTYSPVPEPGTLLSALVLASCSVLGFMRKRKSAQF